MATCSCTCWFFGCPPAPAFRWPRSLLPAGRPRRRCAPVAVVAVVAARRRPLSHSLLPAGRCRCRCCKPLVRSMRTRCCPPVAAVAAHPLGRCLLCRRRRCCPPIALVAAHRSMSAGRTRRCAGRCRRCRRCRRHCCCQPVASSLQPNWALRTYCNPIVLAIEHCNS